MDGDDLSLGKCRKSVFIYIHSTRYRLKYRLSSVQILLKEHGAVRTMGGLEGLQSAVLLSFEVISLSVRHTDSADL